MNVANLLVRTAKRAGDLPAIHVGTHVLHDYRTFARRASSIGAALRKALSLHPGDRIAIFATNGPAYLETLQAAWIAGLTAVPVNAKLHPKELRTILDDSGAAALFVSDDLAASVHAAVEGLPAMRYVVVAGTSDYEAFAAHAPTSIVERAPDDVAWLFYTSGTTGRPKGVMLTHRNLLAMTLCYFADVDAAESADAFIYAAPMSHGAGLYALAQVAAGARHVVPESGGFDAAEFMSLASAHQRTCAFAAPTMVKRLVDHAADRGLRGDALKTIVYGGAPMYAADIVRAIDVLGDRFVQIYGQGESPMTITALSRDVLRDRRHPRYGERVASVGVAQTAVEVRVVDEHDRPLSAGEAGEIIVRGDTVMRGYWNNAEATAQTLRGGWLHTGDVGSLDDDGYLTLKDRSKDVIISGGANIYPREVEEVLLTHPGVHEACVVGRRHPDWGEEVVAFVVTRPGTTVDASSLDALCLANIARFKRPKAYRFVESLPKNNYGKVLKREIRAWLDDEASSR